MGFLRLTASGGYADHSQRSTLSKSYTSTSHPDMTIRFVGWLSRTISLISQSFFFHTEDKDDPNAVQLNIQKQKAMILSWKIICLSGQESSLLPQLSTTIPTMTKNTKTRNGERSTSVILVV